MTAQIPDHEDQDYAARPPVILLMGPTASGKSGIALDIASSFPVEIISVDSAQVYRHMDIGTAKPSQEARALVPHHLIDLIEPHQRYSAAQFLHDAQAALRGITERGNIPLLAGGTMLYFRTLIEGLSELPAADGVVRAMIEDRARMRGWPELHADLSQLDPASAARIKPTDSQRIQRALEVYYLTGKPMSEIIKESRAPGLPYRTISIALVPGDRGILHQRIAQRFEDMLELGLIDEVRAIRDKFRITGENPSMRCVGYRQVWMYLEKKVNVAEMRQKALAATRQLAKRQLTWLRSMRHVHEFDCLAENLPDQVRRHLEAAGLQSPGASKVL
ncbi:MAG TPA: tRNA (adenosine(37)-N6)-dimethylallyltransferase MiaA [Nitrosospira sp.]|nr:tRNA (adenosine(37)-N6)-dimethylallyltransferase MiaA [Nitrosospira sp.]